MKTTTNCSYLIVLLIAFLTAHGSGQDIKIIYDTQIKMHEFAVNELSDALEQSGYKSIRQDLASRDKAKPSFTIYLISKSASPFPALLDRINALCDSIPSQGYLIHRPDGNQLWLVGGDNRGVLYGTLDLAETLFFTHDIKKIKSKSHTPAIQNRGLKFNIPLDARTPGYDDTGDAAQENIVEMWNFEFWTTFFDHMARYRYNTLTLWNPHPFPSLIKVPEYPDVALEDICVTTAKPVHKGRLWGDPQFVSQMVLDSLKTIKKMSIEEKISFWQNVMQYAKDRGIDIYFITWNIAMNSVAPPGNWMQQKPHPGVSVKGGQYGITNEQDNTTTMDYVRASVRELLLTYPLLKGIGVTAGENMVHRKDKFAKEQWLWRTYGLGIMDAKKRQSNRTVYFLHRVWQGGLGDIMQDFAANYPDPFSIGFKYARAHMYSSTRPPFANQILQEMDDYKVKCWWNLRNDDIFNFRWGDPDYVREFLSNLPPENKTAGYHMGSDGYVWGREFTSLNPDDPRVLELEKHWFSFMLWGRLGYDLNLSNNHFQDMLEHRFPQMQSKLLYNAWASASKIIPLVNRFHWRNWDYMWAVEGCMDQRHGFHTVQDFIDTEPMEGSDLLSIPQAVKRLNPTKSSTEQMPLQVADSLYKYANTSIKTIESLLREYNVENKELQHTLDDIRAMSYLGRYYGSKIRGAFYLHQAHISKQPNWINKTLQELIDALGHWRLYAKTASQLYKPQMLARTRQLDWYERLTDASEDLSIVTRNGHEDWVSLFNGQDLSGWSVQCLPEDKEKTYWSVDNGSILANSMGDPDHDYIWLVTDKEYNDFVLDLKFQTYRQVTGNSGIQIRSRYDTRAGWLDGPQVDIAPPLPWRTGMMYDETRGYRRWISPNIEKGNWVDSTLSNPNLRFFYADDKNQWNTIRIYAIGDKVAIILNGIPINTLTENNILDDSIHLERQVGMQGHIALQIHKNDELKIRFKDIKIMEF